MEQLHTIAEVSAATTLSKATLYRLMREGRMEFIQIGSRRLVSESALAKVFVPQICDPITQEPHPVTPMP